MYDGIEFHPLHELQETEKAREERSQGNAGLSGSPSGLLGSPEPAARAGQRLLHGNQNGSRCRPAPSHAACNTPTQEA